MSKPFSRQESMTVTGLNFGHPRVELLRGRRAWHAELTLAHALVDLRNLREWNFRFKSVTHLTEVKNLGASRPPTYLSIAILSHVTKLFQIHHHRFHTASFRASRAIFRRNLTFSSTRICRVEADGKNGSIVDLIPVQW